MLYYKASTVQHESAVKQTAAPTLAKPLGSAKKDEVSRETRTSELVFVRSMNDTVPNVGNIIQTYKTYYKCTHQIRKFQNRY